MELRDLEDSLAAVTEDQIGTALRNSLDLLHQACEAQAERGGGNDGCDQAAEAVQYRVKCCCCLLKRAGALVADSDFLLEDISRALQEKLHSRSLARQAILMTHLNTLVSVPLAFELILRSLPSNPALQGSFYARLADEVCPLSAVFMPGGKLAEHLRRELRKSTQGHFRVHQLGESSMSLAHSPHLPVLLQLALRVGASGSGAEHGKADTLHSSVSERTQLRTRELQSAARQRPKEASGGLSRRLLVPQQALGRDDSSVRAAAAVLRMLQDPDVLLAQLGLAETSGGAGSPPEAAEVPDCLAELLGGAVLASEPLAPVEDRIGTALQLIELLITTIYSAPQVAWRIETWAAHLRASAAFGQAAEHTLVPVSAASNETADSWTWQTQGASPLDRPAGEPGCQLPAAAERQLEQLSLDLLSLHFALSSLGGTVTGGGAKRRRLLGGSALWSLCLVALRQLQEGGKSSSGAGQHNTRGSGMKTPRAKALGSVIPPEVVAHVLRVVREGYENDSLAAEEAPEGSDAGSLAETALAFCTVAFKGPQQCAAYECRLDSYQAIRKAKLPAGALPPAPEPEAVPPAHLSGDHSDRPAKRHRVSSPTRRADEPPATSLPCQVKDESAEGQQLSKKAPKATRRIVPVQISQEERGSTESLPTCLPDDLRTDKDLAWFEGMIATKMEFTQSVLQDLVEEEEEETLLGPPGAPGWQKTGSPTGGSNARMLGYSVNSNPAFRELEWQALHTSALSLLSKTLQGLVECGADGSMDSSRVWKVLRTEAVWRDHDHMALLGSKIMDPSVSAGPRFHAARKGARALPHECLVLGATSRMAQYCIGPGRAVSPPLAGQFLQLLDWLTSLCEAERQASGEPDGHMTRPVTLASNIVMACIERGSLRFIPLDADDIPAVLRCILPAMDSLEALTHFSAALWAAPQSWLSAAAFRKFPSCLSAASGSWIAMWMKLPTAQHVKATCKTLAAGCLELLLRSVRALGAEAGATGESFNPDDWLEAFMALATAVRNLCRGIVEKGKALTTKSTLRNTLAAASLLLKFTTACTAAAVGRAGAEPMRANSSSAASKRQVAAELGRPGSKLEKVSSKTRKSSKKPSKKAAQSEEEVIQSGASTSQLAAAAGGGMLLAGSCRKLLEWRQQTCRGCERRLAETLEDWCSAQERGWRRLSSLRGGEPSTSEASSSCLEEIEDGLGSVLADEDSDCEALGRPQETIRQVADDPTSEDYSAEESQAKPSSRKGLRQPANAYMRAVQAEERRMGYANSDDESNFSDLEDFIVCKEERDYNQLIAAHFKYTTGRRRNS